MRIAIVSDTGLPDARVEKEAITLTKLGHDVSIIGPRRDSPSILNKTVYGANIKIYDTPWTREARLKIEPYYSWLKRKIKKILTEIKADVVLAANIFAGIVVHELHYPMVLDDHELYSLEITEVEHKGLIKKIILLYKKRLFENLEKIIAHNHPIIVVSEKIKEYYLTHYGVPKGKIFVIKNYPTLVEVERIKFKELDCRRIVMSYIGEDIIKYKGRKYRDMRITYEIIRRLYKKKNKITAIVIGSNIETSKPFTSLGYVEHMKIYDILASSHFGLLTWNPSRFHEYCNPNKPYMYAHAGAIPIITEDLRSVIEDFDKELIKLISTKNFRNSLYKLLENIVSTTECDKINSLRYRILKYAKRKLLWDNYEKIIDYVIRV